MRPLKLPFCRDGSGHCMRRSQRPDAAQDGWERVRGSIPCTEGPKTPWVSDPHNLKTFSLEGSFYIHVTLTKPPSLEQEWAYE